MSIVFVGTLIVLGLAGAIAFAMAVPALLGAMAWDVSGTREISATKVADARVRIAVERTVARGFVVAGGVFWSVASFAGLYAFEESGLRSALIAALIPLLAIAVTLIVGWYFERMAAALLVLASAAVVAWGVIYQFELGVWLIMGFFLMGPMLTAATLFWLARREQNALELAISLRPELAQLVPAEISAN